MKVQVDNVRVNEPDTVTEFLLDGGGFFLAFEDYGGKFDDMMAVAFSLHMTIMGESLTHHSLPAL